MKIWRKCGEILEKKKGEEGMAVDHESSSVISSSIS